MQLQIQKQTFYLVALMQKEKEKVRLVVSTDPDETLRSAMHKSRDDMIVKINQLKAPSKRWANMLRKTAYDILLDPRRSGLRTPHWVGNMSIRKVVGLFHLLADSNTFLDEEIKAAKK
jgi:hypothetical protein